MLIHGEKHNNSIAARALIFVNLWIEGRWWRCWGDEGLHEKRWQQPLSHDSGRAGVQPLWIPHYDKWKRTRNRSTIIHYQGKIAPRWVYVTKMHLMECVCVCVDPVLSFLSSFLLSLHFLCSPLFFSNCLSSSLFPSPILSFLLPFHFLHLLCSVFLLSLFIFLTSIIFNSPFLPSSFIDLIFLSSLLLYLCLFPLLSPTPSLFHLSSLFSFLHFLSSSPPPHPFARHNRVSGPYKPPWGAAGALGFGWCFLPFLSFFPASLLISVPADTSLRSPWMLTLKYLGGTVQKNSPFQPLRHSPISSRSALEGIKKKCFYSFFFVFFLIFLFFIF